jgi:hypothetical protein
MSEQMFANAEDPTLPIPVDIPDRLLDNQCKPPMDSELGRFRLSVQIGRILSLSAKVLRHYPRPTRCRYDCPLESSFSEPEWKVHIPDFEFEKKKWKPFVYIPFFTLAKSVAELIGPRGESTVAKAEFL